MPKELTDKQKRQVILIEMLETQIEKGLFPEANETMRQAAPLDPKNGLIWWWKLHLEFRAKDMSELAKKAGVTSHSHFYKAERLGDKNLKEKCRLLQFEVKQYQETDTDQKEEKRLQKRYEQRKKQRELVQAVKRLRILLYVMQSILLAVLLVFIGINVERWFFYPLVLTVVVSYFVTYYGLDKLAYVYPENRLVYIISVVGSYVGNAIFWMLLTVNTYFSLAGLFFMIVSFSNVLHVRNKVSETVMMVEKIKVRERQKEGVAPDEYDEV